MIARPAKSIVILTVITLLMLVVFEEVYDDVFSDPTEGDKQAIDFDQRMIDWFQSARTDRLDQIMVDITALGSVSLITIFSLILIGVMFSRRDYISLIYIGLIIFGTLIIPFSLKSILDRERPQIENQITSVATSSFPSGHSFASACFYLALAFMASGNFRKAKLEILFYLSALLILGLVAISRIYLGVHYPSDIIAGLALGTAWTALVSMAFVWWHSGKSYV